MGTAGIQDHRRNIACTNHTNGTPFDRHLRRNKAPVVNQLLRISATQIFFFISQSVCTSLPSKKSCSPNFSKPNLV